MLSTEGVNPVGSRYKLFERFLTPALSCKPAARGFVLRATSGKIIQGRVAPAEVLRWPSACIPALRNSWPRHSGLDACNFPTCAGEFGRSAPEPYTACCNSRLETRSILA